MSALLSDKEWLLKIAAEVEQDPSRWTQGANARTADGQKRFQGAVCWCAIGFNLRDFDQLPYSIGKALTNAVGCFDAYDTGFNIVEYNDDSISTAAEFVAWFRRAAELCE